MPQTYLIGFVRPGGAESIKEFMRNLKVEDILKWDAAEVAQAFLVSIGLPRLMQPFMDHKVRVNLSISYRAFTNMSSNCMLLNRSWL